MNANLKHLLLSAINELEVASKHPFVKSAHVLAAAINYAGLLTESRKKAIYTEVDPPVDEIITRFHAALISLVREPDVDSRLVFGQGNFGDPNKSEPPANPLFTECSLTDLGRASLRSSHPLARHG